MMAAFDALEEETKAENKEDDQKRDKEETNKHYFDEISVNIFDKYSTKQIQELLDGIEGVGQKRIDNRNIYKEYETTFIELKKTSEPSEIPKILLQKFEKTLPNQKTLNALRKWRDLFEDKKLASLNLSEKAEKYGLSFDKPDEMANFITQEVINNPDVSDEIKTHVLQTYLLPTTRSIDVKGLSPPKAEAVTTGSDLSEREEQAAEKRTQLAEAKDQIDTKIGTLKERISKLETEIQRLQALTPEEREPDHDEKLEGYKKELADLKAHLAEQETKKRQIETALQKEPAQKLRYSSNIEAFYRDGEIVVTLQTKRGEQSYEIPSDDRMSGEKIGEFINGFLTCEAVGEFDLWPLIPGEHFRLKNPPANYQLTRLSTISDLILTGHKAAGEIMAPEDLDLLKKGFKKLNPPDSLLQPKENLTQLGILDKGDYVNKKQLYLALTLVGTNVGEGEYDFSRLRADLNQEPEPESESQESPKKDKKGFLSNFFG